METIGILNNNISANSTAENTSRPKLSSESTVSDNISVNDKVEIVSISSKPETKADFSKVAVKASSPQTSIQFTVAEEGEDRTEIKFQVVDKKTGEIIREFPKEDLVKQHEVNGIQIKEGLFVDSVV